MKNKSWQFGELKEEQTYQLIELNEQLRCEIKNHTIAKEAMLKQQERLEKQLVFTSALNQLAEVTILNDDIQVILESMSTIVGEKLGVDRSLIYNIDFETNQVIGLCEWLNPIHPDISPTKDTYSIDIFPNAANFVGKHRCWLESHANNMNSFMISDGSAELLHKHMSIKSLLWYPFLFQEHGYYCLVFNQVQHTRSWHEEEIKFLSSVAKHVEIAIQKIHLLEGRKGAENKLREQLYFMQRLLNTIPNPVFYKDTKGIYQGCNTAFEKYTGLNMEEMVGKPVHEIYPEKLANIYHEKDSSLFEVPGIQIYETSFPVADGTWRDVVFNKATFTDIEGNISGLVGVINDITERKKQEKDLKYRIEFENLITSISTKFINLKTDQVDCGINNALQLLGEFAGVDRCCVFMFYNGGEKINITHEWCNRGIEPQINILKGLNSKDFPWWMEKLKKMDSIYIPRVKELPPEADVEKKILEQQGIQSISVVPMTNGNSLIGFLGFDSTRTEKNWSEENITLLGIVGEIFVNALEKKRALEALEEERVRLFSLLEGLPVLVFLHAPDYTIPFANRYFMERFGEPGKKHCYEMFEERQKPCKQCRAFSVFETRQAMNWEWVLPNGQTINIYNFPFADIDGSPLVLSLGVDITEHKQLEKEMAHLDRLNLIGQMAAGIGHEVRNPMTTVRGFLQMLSEKKECHIHKEYFNIMIDELDRANSIITEYLSVAKKSPPSLKPDNLNEILESLRPLIEADAIQSDQNVIFQLRDVPNIPLNDKEIRQLILNLVRNAVEAMHSKGTITIRTFLDRSFVVLAVQDEGGGIDQEVIEKLGTPFFTTKDQGTGLGLAVCYSIVNRHNATINIESDATGTTFIVRFGATF